MSLTQQQLLERATSHQQAGRLEPGQTHASRVGLSILTHARTPECIAPDADDYVRLAAELASDIPRLDKFRTESRPRLLASSLCDEQGFTRKLEAAYEQMWADVISSA